MPPTPASTRISTTCYLMAAQKRLLSVEKVVPPRLVKAVPPQALLINRMMVDSVVEAPNGAHFTTAAPDYGRDEKFQRHYAEAAGPTRRGRSSSAPVRQRGRLPGGGAQVRGGGRDFRDPCRGVRRRVRGTVPRRRRDHGQPDDDRGVGGRAAGAADLLPDILLTDGEAQLLADTPALGAAGAIEGWMPFGRVFETLAWGRRHVVMGANQIDRYGNQNLSAFGPLQHPTRQMFGVRARRATPSTTPPATGVGNHSKRVFCDTVDVVSGIGWTRSIPRIRRTGSSTCTGWCPTSASSTSRTTPDARGVAAPRRLRRRRARGNVVRGARAGRGGEDAAGHLRRAEADPRGDRSEVAAGQGSTV